MTNTIERLLAVFAIACLAGLAGATDLRVRILGPVAGGDVTFGFHDDFLMVEGCGGTCFAPTVCAVTVTCPSGDTPSDVAARIAAAINADPDCQAEGYAATSSRDALGGLLNVTGPANTDFTCCADFWNVSDRRGCCSIPGPTDCGTFVCLSSVYCVAKKNSLGCLPAIGSTGDPGFSSPDPFLIHLASTLNGQAGLLVYGANGGAQIPFAQATLCVHPPVRRTPVQSAGGSPPPAQDCSGSYAFDFNAWLQTGQDPELAPGDVVSVQYWIRDPAQPDGTGVSLSDALDFTLDG